MVKLLIVGFQPTIAGLLSARVHAMGVEPVFLSSVESEYEKALHASGSSGQTLLLNYEPMPDPAAKKLIQTCLQTKTHFFDFCDSRNVISDVLKESGAVSPPAFVPGLATHIVPFEYLARFLRKKLPIACKITMAAREKSFYPEAQSRSGAPAAPTYERKISFFGDVRTCISRPKDATSEWLESEVGVGWVELLDCLEPPHDSFIETAPARYWGMVEEEKGIFRVQNFQTASSLNRAIGLTLALVKAFVSGAGSSPAGLKLPSEVVGESWIEGLSETKWLEQEIIRMAGLKIKNPAETHD